MPIAGAVPHCACTDQSRDLPRKFVIRALNLAVKALQATHTFHSIPSHWTSSGSPSTYLGHLQDDFFLVMARRYHTFVGVVRLGIHQRVGAIIWFTLLSMLALLLATRNASRWTFPCATSTDMARLRNEFFPVIARQCHTFVERIGRALL